MTKLLGAMDIALAPTPLNIARGEARADLKRVKAELPGGALPDWSCVLMTSSGEPTTMPAMAPTEPAPAFNKKSSMPLRVCIYRQRGNFWL